MLKNKTVRKLFLTMFCILAGVIFARAESCSSAGQIQYKASGTCSTSQRTCCSNGSWSDWGGSCPAGLSPVASTVVLKLNCEGSCYYYESFGNGMFQDYYDPTYSIPYPKCGQNDICSGKSSGYICYKSYTSADSQCTENDYCNYWTESGTTDQSMECFWGGKADVTVSIITCK